MKILFVEDEKPTRESWTAILTRQGYEVVSAFDGQDALEKLESFSAELIITDTRMPRMDGANLICHAKQRWPAIRTILVSGNSNVKKWAAECGADATLEKPFDREDMVAAIKKFEKD